jgi:hypothetical protein
MNSVTTAKSREAEVLAKAHDWVLRFGTFRLRHCTSTHAIQHRSNGTKGRIEVEQRYEQENTVQQLTIATHSTIIQPANVCTGAKGKAKPSAKASAAAKATLRGVSPHPNTP